MTHLFHNQAVFAFAVVWLLSLIQRWRSMLNDWGHVLCLVELHSMWADGVPRDCPGRGVLVFHPFDGAIMALDQWFPLKWRFHDYYAKFFLEPLTSDSHCWSSRYLSLCTLWEHLFELFRDMGREACLLALWSSCHGRQYWTIKPHFKRTLG